MVKAKTEAFRLGTKVRSLRRRQGVSQAQLAEADRGVGELPQPHREQPPGAAGGAPVQAGAGLGVEVQAFAGDDDATLGSDLLEVFSDPLFEASALKGADVQELVATSPAVSREVLRLYRAYQSARESAEVLAQQLADAGDGHSNVAAMHAPSRRTSATSSSAT